VTDGVPPSSDRTASAPEGLQARVEEVLALIRPAIREDGGDVRLVEVTAEGVVRLKFSGACVGCPSMPQTLQHGIERNLRERVPEVRKIVAET